MIGLFLIAFGNGGLNGCDVALGADQFELPQQQAHMDSYFSKFYIYINLGALVAYLVGPLLRGHHFAGSEDNYSLIFLVVFVAFLVFAGLLAFAHKLFKKERPQGNVLYDFCNCIWVIIALDLIKFQPKRILFLKLIC